MNSALLRYVPLLILALAWEAVARLGLVSSLALPPFSRVAAAWLDLARDGELWTNGLASLYRVSAGLALAVAIGLRSASPWRGGKSSMRSSARWSSFSIRSRSRR